MSVSIFDVPDDIIKSEEEMLKGYPKGYIFITGGSAKCTNCETYTRWSKLNAPNQYHCIDCIKINQTKC